MSVDSLESAFFLPNILAKWPWKRNINQHHIQAQAASSAWIQGFITSTPRVQRAFYHGKFELLCCLAYPLENEDVFRVGCDLVNWFFLFDEYTDAATPDEVQQMATIVMDTLRNPDKPRSGGECIVGEAIRQLWNLSLKCASVGARRRLIEALDKFTSSIVQQAQDRVQNPIRNIDEYFALRRGTIGADGAFTILEFALNLPDQVFEDPVIQRLTNTCIDMIIISNDLCSYNVEQARGDGGHNYITVLMHHENIGLNEAIKRIGKYSEKLVRLFLNDLRHVPFFGEEVKADVKRYLDGLGNWVRANDCWNFECQRYFRTNGLEIQQSRKVVLLPR